MQFAVLIALLFATLTIYRQTTFALKGATHVDQDRVLLLLASPCTDSLARRGARRAGRRGRLVRLALRAQSRRQSRQRDDRRAPACSSPPRRSISASSRSTASSRWRAACSTQKRPADDGATHADDAPPIVINESAVRSLGFASPQAALGHWVDWHFIAADYAGLKGDPNRARRPAEIVGVVPDFTFGSVRKPIEPTLYFVGVKTGMFSSVALNVKLDGGARRRRPSPRIDRIWKVIGQDQPLQQVYANQFMLRLYIDTIVQGAFIAVCALIAVSVACLGLFALSAYTAERRTKEIGVRKAMGASTGDILRLLLWQFLWPVLIANLIAWPIGFIVMNWWLQGFAYRVDQPPWTFLAAGGAAVVIALVTVFFQALRVSRAKPVAALRYE